MYILNWLCNHGNLNLANVIPLLLFKVEMDSTANVEVQSAPSEKENSVDIAALKQNVSPVEAPPCENGTATPDVTPRGDEEVCAATAGATPTGTQAYGVMLLMSWP